jgi:hypothetical protein
MLDLSLKEKAVMTLAILGLVLGSVGCTERNSYSNQNSEDNTKTAVIQTIEKRSTLIPTPTPTPTKTLEPSPTITETLEPTTTATSIPTSENILVRGYFVNATYTCESLDGNWCNTLVIDITSIRDITVEDGEIILEMVFVMYGREYHQQVHTKSFKYKKYNLELSGLSLVGNVTPESEDLDYFSNVEDGHFFQAEMQIDGHQQFSDDLVMRYVNNYESFDFQLLTLVEYKP